VAHLETILAKGGTIGMDRFGVNMLLAFEKRVSTVAEMCRRGHADRMVLSHDACCHFDFIPYELVPQMAPQWNFRHIPDDVIPALRKEGVTEEQLLAMTVANPRRLFERQGAY
jgi:phosphotriesterase-related protein